MNLLRIPSKDAYSYGRALLDQLFTKQEQKPAVVLKSSKSSKPALSPRRVELMFGKYCVCMHILRFDNHYIYTCYSFSRLSSPEI